MLNPQQKDRLNHLENTKRSPAEEEEYLILKSYQEEPQPAEFGISHCRHDRAGKVIYSLDIEVQDRHVSISASGYHHRPGYYVKLAIFDLQLSDIKALGEALITEALKVEIEEKAETPDK